jgi:hypothetical protein
VGYANPTACQLKKMMEPFLLINEIIVTMNSLQIQFEVDRLNASLRDVFRIVVYGNMGNSNATERMITSYDSLLDNLTQRLMERLTDMQHTSSLHDTMDSLSHMYFDKSRFEPPPYSVPVAPPPRVDHNHISPNVIVTKAERQTQETQQTTQTQETMQTHFPPTLIMEETPDNRSPFVKVHKTDSTELVTADIFEDEGEVVEADEAVETEEDNVEEEEAEEGAEGDEEEEEEAEGDEEEGEADEDEEEEEEAEVTEIRKIGKKKYHVGVTSQIAYEYVDKETMGEMVGIVKDDKVVPRA